MTLQQQKAPIIGAGQSHWNVHVHDLSDLFTLLVEAAIACKNDNDGLWGNKACYLAENGEHSWGDIAVLVAQSAAEQDYIPKPKAEQIDIDTAKKLAGFESLSWGLNSRGRARRARTLLGWRSSRPGLVEELLGIVRSEWRRLQM